MLLEINHHSDNSYLKKLKHLIFILVTSLLLINTSTSLASEPAYKAESDFFGEVPQVLTVSRLHKPRDESPASVTVIDREMIRNSGFREIADIFRMVPGFVVGYQQGHSPAVTYHGLGQQWMRQLQVLIDGRSVFIPSFGGVPWSNLPLLLEDIERVEITRGPNAVTYGANAFLATINIITRHAAEDSGGAASYSHDLDDDSNAQDLYVRYGNNYGDLDWRLSAGREKDDGYSNEHDGKLLEKINFRTDFLSAHNSFWVIQAGINQASLQRGDDSTADPTRDDETYNSYQNIKWELIDERVNTTLLFTHTKQDVDDNFITEPLNDYLAQETGNPAFTNPIVPDITSNVNFDRTSERTDFEIYQNRFLDEALTWNYGLSIRKDEVKSFYLFNDYEKHQVDTNRVFTSLEWKLPEQWIVDAGLILEDTNYTDTEDAMRLSVLKKIDKHNFRFVHSTAYRNPILWEEIGETQFVIDIPSPLLGFSEYPIVLWRTSFDLVPEKIESTELGVYSEYMERQLTTDIKLFSYKISDQITEQELTLTPEDPVTGFEQTFDIAVNGDTTRVQGLEIAMNFQPKQQPFRIYAGISLIDVEAGTDNFEDSFPEYSGFVGGHYDFNPRHQFSSTLYLMDQLIWTDRTTDTEAYKKLDIRYRYRLDTAHEIFFELIGYNLVEEYRDYLLYDEQERSLLLRLSGKF